MKVIGIKFKEGGKVYYFAPNENEIYETGMQVVVETSKSVEFATVAFPPKEVEDSEVTQPLKPILRIATDKDIEQARRNLERKPQAMKLAQEKIEKHNLDMKLIDCEFTFDGNKVIFYFAADGRIDFRDLVKDLAGAFHIRIELRQVGIRDETRLLGGIAPCGRECCCAGAMSDFKKVSIKMAKVQGLSLNPGKISGLCGRLMCCLSYENEYYSEVYKKMPKIGAEVSTPEGKGTVVSTNMLKLTVRTKQEKDGSLVYRDFPLDDIRFRGKKGEPEEDAEDFEDEELEAYEPERLERSEQRERQEKHERGVRPANKNRERAERPAHGCRNGKGERCEQNGRNERGERRGKPDRGGEPNGRREENSPRGERRQNEKHNKAQRQGRPPREQTRQGAEPHIEE